MLFIFIYFLCMLDEIEPKQDEIRFFFLQRTSSAFKYIALDHVCISKVDALVIFAVYL